MTTTLHRRYPSLHHSAALAAELEANKIDRMALDAGVGPNFLRHNHEYQKAIRNWKDYTCLAVFADGEEDGINFGRPPQHQER